MSDDGSLDETVIRETVLHPWHVEHAKTIADFGGWDMPIRYDGEIQEHKTVRKAAGLFDVSHMGRLEFSGKDAERFLQYVLTNNAAGLEVGDAQYTLISDENGFALDDAYLYKTGEDKFTLVVNASNREKDVEHLQKYMGQFSDLEFEDRTFETAMMSLQGPNSEHILEAILAKEDNSGRLSEAKRNKLSTVNINGHEVTVARTGYTGEPVCFELTTENDNAVALWEEILSYKEDYGVEPIGLAARDTLRLEAHLPLYGHELGEDSEGNPIPIYAISLARKANAVNLDPNRGDFVGRAALERQGAERESRDALIEGDTVREHPVPYDERELKRVVMPIAIMNKDCTGPGKLLPRQGYEVLNSAGDVVGHITSGTSVPYWEFDGQDVTSSPTEDAKKRPIALALIDSHYFPSRAGQEDREVFTVRQVMEDPGDGKRARKPREAPAYIVKGHSRQAAPYVHAVVHPENTRETPVQEDGDLEALMTGFVTRTAENTIWRQTECFNLIPSEQTSSSLVRALADMDPAGRYGERDHVNAYGRNSPPVPFYRGTAFEMAAAEIVIAELARFFNAGVVEPRVISGQQANISVFEGMVEWINRSRLRSNQPRRMEAILSNGLIKGGHLSSQYMGALKSTTRIDPALGGPAVYPMPVCDDNPYMLDVDKLAAVIEQRHPELIILGKSMILHKEPVAAVAALLHKMYTSKGQEKPILMFDGAHVAGLFGQHYQQPLDEGADIVTFSTHKTWPGPQRGCIVSNMVPGSEYEQLWAAIQKRAFPGQQSNHHLGTMIAMVAAAYEMRIHGDEYQQQVISNAKAFAKALHKYGIGVEGDSSLEYTETHQVVINVGRGQGSDIAKRLERNNIITNPQALPSDHGFTYASGVRLGVAEMTRFGMDEEHFDTLAGYMAEVILNDKDVKGDVAKFRKDFLEMRYTLPAEQAEPLVQTLRQAWHA